MLRAKKALFSVLLSFAFVLSLCFGIVFAMPTRTAKAETTLASTNWTFARESEGMFRIQNGNTYWTVNTNSVTTASMLDYTEINGKTLTEINTKTPGAITVTLQPASGIGSFYRVNINTEIAGFTIHDIATFVVRAGWTHTDTNDTYKIDTDLYFAHRQGTVSQSDTWKFIESSNVVDITDKIQVQDQGIQATNTRAILVKTTQDCWTAGTPNENGAAFMNLYYVNGKSIKEWNEEAHAALDAGEITDITYGSGHGTISGNKGVYAPIFVWNANYNATVEGSYAQAWIPTGYISDVSSFKICKGMAWLTEAGTLYYVSKDIEYVKSGSSFVKIDSTVDISDAFKLLVQDYTSSNGTMLYYLHTNSVQYWTEQYRSTDAYSINEQEWKGITDSSLQGGAVQMSYLEVNGTPVYDINASDNNAYGATQENIASGSKYAPILAFLTPKELGNAIKLQIPSAYPNGNGVAADNHQTIAIKKGFYVLDTSTNIKYEVTKDIQWDYEDGVWGDHYEEIQTTVTDVTMFGSSSDAFAGIALEGSDYANAPNTYEGTKMTALTFARSANFLSHVLIDDIALNSPGEAFLNVWRNYGYFTFRPGNNGATKITILAGCKLPTYNALLTGTKEVYVTTEDVTFVKGSDGTWAKDEGVKSYSVTFTVDGSEYTTQTVEEGATASEPTAPTKAESEKYTYVFNGWALDGAAYDFATPVSGNITLEAVFTEQLKAGEYATSISSITYARDNANNWMMFALTDKDYPDAGTKYNIATTEDQISALNFYDKIVVDGYTLRSRMNTCGTPAEAPKINLWQANCLGIRIAGAEGALDGAKKVTIRAGAQFPSYAYVTAGVEAYYVTTEEITFVNVGNESGAWERQYKATFMADGDVVKTISYLLSDGFTAPEVPEKDGYKGAWESYTANGNITVNAVYTERTISYENTNISEVKDQEGFLILTLTNDDYSSAGGTWWGPNGSNAKEVLAAMKALDFHVYDATGAEFVLGDDAIINVWGQTGNDLAFYLSGYSSSNMPTTVTFKKGCEFPSYAYVNDGTDLCYELTENVTFNKVNGEWIRETELTESNTSLPTDFEDNYILSDLYQGGYANTEVFKDGIQTLTYTDGSESDYHYGRMDSNSFMLSFDFKYTSATYYGSFVVMLGTEGYNEKKACFGWRFYLLRGNDTNGITQDQCVQFFSAVCDTATYANGNIATHSLIGSQFVEGQTYHVTIGYHLVDTNTVLTYVSIDGIQVAKEEYAMGGTFSTYAPYANSICFTTEQAAAGTVTISDPNVDMTTAKYTAILDDGSTKPREITSDSLVLPTLNPVDYDMAGNVFVGWTTDSASLSTLYPAGYELTLSGDITLYPVWIGFTMQNGAAVRKASPSGIRFLVDVDENGYTTGVRLGLIKEIGTILCPSSYLDGRELTHELGEGYYVAVQTTTWNTENKTYSAAFTNLSADQYTRSFSARGYMKINYTTGEGYIYTAYDANEHARSMYQVANAATKAGESIATDVDYINNVADILVNADLTVEKNENAEGSYTVSSTVSDGILAITVSGSVKSVLINGVRLVMGYDARIEIDGVYYNLSNYVLSSNGLTFSFALTQNGNSDALLKKYHISVIQSYLNSDAYTAQHKAYIEECIDDTYGIIDLINNSTTVTEYIEEYYNAIAELERIKTAAELKADNTGATTLDAPVLSKGLGYTVTWTEVKNANYYVVHDDNDYRESIIVMKNQDKVYEAEVVGNHNVTVTAHSYYEEYNSSTSNTIATTEVKPVFSYKSMQDGLYKFSSSQMSTMGLSTDDGYYYDSSAKLYFAYYNKDTGWSANAATATDWTSPVEFPAHAQRLKDMGNNVILIAYDSNASYKEGDTWKASRLKYVMDTAWSMGMKVLVCDEVFYKFSMSDGSDSAATSKEEVATAISSRNGFADYVTHPAFYGFSLDDEPYAEYLEAMHYTIGALDDACAELGVEDPFYLACLFQSYGSDKLYTGDTLTNYYKDWLSIEGVDGKYLYVDIYTQHAMDYTFYSLTNRYENSFDAVYGGDLGDKSSFEFYQAITSHTQNDGTLSEQDLYMSLLYAAAHDVAGYAWFCYFPITGELAASMVGYDGNGYGNGIGNNASGSYYSAAKKAGYQFELLQGLLDGYDWKTRSVSGNLLTTTLSNGTNTATMYVNADEDEMSSSVTVTVSGSQCYLVGYGVGTDAAPYEAVTSGSSVTLAPGQAVICME